MSSCDWKTDGQWDWSLDVRSTAVANAVNDKHEDEGDESLDENALTSWQLWSDGGDSQVPNEFRWSCSLEKQTVMNQSFARDMQAIAIIKLSFLWERKNNKILINNSDVQVNLHRRMINSPVNQEQTNKHPIDL